MRKLASIQKVLALEPITDADRIEVAVINGWRCVVKKGEFVVGDLGVFLEIDSVPPDVETFSFLWQRNPKEGEEAVVLPRPGNFRLRTAKLRGVISQGLLLPLEAVYQTTMETNPGVALPILEEGLDVTELLGITKYEPPLPPGMDLAGPFPGYLSRTDEERVQSAPQVLEEIAGKPYVITLKLDGTSGTFTLNPRDGEFYVCGRNYILKETDGPHWRVARKYGIEALLRAQTQNYALQGEVVGPGIQGNRLGLKEVDFFVFNVYDVTMGRHLPHAEAKAFVEANGLKFVPVLEEGDAFSYTQEELLAKAEGKYPNTTNEREGMVIRALSGEASPTLGGRLSFKVVSNRFLLKGGD